MGLALASTDSTAKSYTLMISLIIAVVSLVVILTATGLLWFWFVRSQD